MDVVLIQEGQFPILAAIATDGAVNLVVGERGRRSGIAHLDADAMAALCDVWLSRIPCDPEERVRPVNGEV